jgi:hypothetical protein
MSPESVCAYFMRNTTRADSWTEDGGVLAACWRHESRMKAGWCSKTSR